MKMLLVGCILVVLLIPTESASSPLWAHQEAHKSGSVRRLKVNETVDKSGSDLVFSWARCAICDGYEVRLYLQDVSGRKEIPYQLKSAVTALRVADVPPRTTYEFVINRLPPDGPSSVLSGRSYSPEAPPPVEKLTAHALTSTSIRIDWWSKNADGFVVQIFRNNTEVYEDIVPDFRNHSTLSLDDFSPETTYEVKVTAFYYPPTGRSKSPPSSVLVKTLPSELPTIELNWKLNPKLELYWKNPVFPSPVAHKLTCTQNSRTLLGAQFTGSTDSVIVTKQVDALSSDIECVLETWFSERDETQVTSNVKIRKEPPSPSSKNSSLAGTFKCRLSYNYYEYVYVNLDASAVYDREEVDGKELLILKFNYSTTNSVIVKEVNYRLCENESSCDTPFITSREYSRVLVNPAYTKPWKPYTVQFNLTIRCNTDADRTSSVFSTTGFLKLPVLIGDVDPVRKITAASKRVSWQYSSSSPDPDYFIVTHCVGDDCTSQSVSGQDRSLTFGKLKEHRVYFVSIQAAKFWENKLYLSPMKMTSMVAPKETPGERLTLTANEIGNSSTVQLLITHEVTPEDPPMVEYHVVVCSKPLSLWNDPALNNVLRSNGSCESIESTNSSLDLIRAPWTSYEVSVLLCFGEYDFNDPVNLTLPIFKKRPEPVAQLSWDQKHSMITWEYESFTPSGFSVAICPPENDDCTVEVVGPLERQYNVANIRYMPFLGDFIASVKPFVTYNGRDYYGLESKLEVQNEEVRREAQ